MSHSVAPARRTWPWVVAVVAVVAVIVVGASVISSLIAHPSSAPAAVAPTLTASATPSSIPTASETPSSTPSATETLDAAAIQAAIEANQPKDLYDYLADPVHVTFAASDFDSDRTPDLAITDLEYVDGSTGWNWNLDEATLTAFRAGTYKNYFPDDAIIGESAETYVIAFTVTDAKVTRIFVSKSAAIVTAAVPAATPTP